jgi:thiamine pyrophosphate-dependent acetolactate synthase large subunit-like protein
MGRFAKAQLIAVGPRLTLTGGDALARVLRASGVVELFGVPAGKLSGFLRAVAQDEAFRYAGTRHEASAAWMAGTVFQATGRIALCFGESGPGSHNLVSALGSLRNNSLAAFVLTPGAPSHVAYPHQGLVMDSDNERLFEPATKWTAVARRPERIPQLVRWALREALTGRPGPVHLEVPVDVLTAEATFDAAELDAPLERHMPAGRTPADPAAVDRAAALLAGAERPLIIAGGGAALSLAEAEVRTLADRLGAAATATQMGLGVVSTEDPRFFGHGGVIGGEAVVRAMEEADVVLAVGCRFSSWLWAGTGPVVAGWPRQDLIQIDADPTAIGRLRAVSVGMAGDARAVLGQLLEAMEPLGAADAAWVSSLVEQHRIDRAAMLAAAQPIDGVMHPAALADELGRALPRDSLVAYDGGHTTFWSNDLTPALAPRTRFHEPGMGHLGFGIPCALALKATFPRRPVVNITGDGAFGFTMAELDSARRHGLPAVHVIHDNQAWGVIRLGQSRSGFDLGTALDGADYAAVARGLGCHGERVERPDEVAPALDRALASGLPAVIDARVAFVPHPGMRRFAGAGSP